MLFGKSNPAKRRNASPLERKQDALREKEEKLLQQQAQLKRLLEEAPRLREETERRRREEFFDDQRLAHPIQREQHTYYTSIPANPAYVPRRTRKQKRDDLYIFLFLVMALIGVAIGVFYLIA